jgi:hypothetical protein
LDDQTCVSPPHEVPHCILVTCQKVNAQLYEENNLAREPQHLAKLTEIRTRITELRAVAK